ncbi:hypothetical protein GLOIN_2v1522971 [Rhizophagus clarus]|uniref:Transmembrane protein n=1 Tax=Rhizophagus clarus TaxID=94130 RepID=A0A8H3LM96_9GLOM|nr:hypothetical protein GLOIN_2v1522971 [Rhizophagus clarus]
MSSSSNSNLILSTVFTVGFIVGGVVVRFVGVNDSKESQQQILIDDIENDQEEKEIDDDDITLQTFYSDKISYNHQYNCLITEINVFKDYSHLQISKSNEKLDFCRQNIKSLQSSFLKGISTLEKINISEINNNMKFQLAEMKWLENFNEIYKEKLDNYYMKNLDEMKRKFNDYEQKTLKEIEDLKYNIEELKCEIGVCDDEETIKEIRQELKFGELTNLLYENGFIET